jgi:hypothetical protein
VASVLARQLPFPRTDYQLVRTGQFLSTATRLVRSLRRSRIRNREPSDARQVLLERRVDGQGDGILAERGVIDLAYVFLVANKAEGQGGAMVGGTESSDTTRLANALWFGMKHQSRTTATTWQFRSPTAIRNRRGRPEVGQLLHFAARRQMGTCSDA